MATYHSCAPSHDNALGGKSVTDVNFIKRGKVHEFSIEVQI